MSIRRRRNIISSDEEGEEVMDEVPVAQPPPPPTTSNRPSRRNSARRPTVEEDSFDDSEDDGDSTEEESFDEDEDDLPKKKASARTRAPRGGAAKQDMKQTKLSNFPMKQIDPYEEDKKAPAKAKAPPKRAAPKKAKAEPKRGTKRKRVDSEDEEDMEDSENSEDDAASYGDDEDSEGDDDGYDTKKKGSANTGGRARKVPSRFTPEDIEPKKPTRTSARSKKPEDFAFPVVTLRQKKKIDYNMDDSSDSADYAESEGEEDEDKKSTTSSKKGSRKEDDTPPQDGAKHVEKILAMRAKTEEAEKQPSVTTQSSQELPHLKPGNPDDPNSNEYLVKYKDLAYIHCDWVSADFIESQKMGKQKLQRFMNKVANTVDPEEPFPSDWVVVERVVAKETRKDGIWYLVKWEGLPYSEATWEREKDVNDDSKIKQYEEFNVPPQEYKEPPRPPANDWYEYKECPQFKHDNQLRAYQLEGLNWLRYCWYNRTNSILADEMGLGKTVQSVSIINSIFTEHKNRGPFLVIAPLSTIPHWEREFENWTFMNVIVYHGNSDARSLMRKFEFHYTDENNKVVQKNLFKFNTLITTFEMIITDSSILSQIKWKYVVIDEAHRLKNRNSRILTEFKHFKFDHLLLLTGTPIQNNTEELWTLLNVLDEKNFPSLNNFLQEFGELKEASQVKSLHSLLKPYLLRRMKEDVEKSLAPKEETIIEVELTRIQKKYYKAILERNFEHLRGGGTSKNLPSLLNIMMELRKCCNHPFLVKGVEEAEMAGRTGHEETNKVLIDSSGKLVLIDKLLPKLQAEGHKVLIFSQMIRVLDILEDYMNYRGYKHERIDGRVRGNDRQAAIDRFSKPDSDIFAFLLCTRAGGLGINLVAADTVIIYDSDWNPQNDLQAQARAHRIGQQKTVKIYRLITRNTYERQMFERASLKLGLDQAVLNQMEDSDGPAVGGKGKAALTSKEVDSLLKYGAYDIFRDEDDAAQKFCEDDIDSILQRRTTTIIQESKEGSSFAKASFASESAVPDIDIDDPEFWKKIMPDVADKPAFDLMAEPRQRKQVQRLEVAMSDDSDSDDDDERDTAVMPTGGGTDEDSDQLYADDENADELNPEDHELPHHLTQKKKGKKGEWSAVHRNRFQKSMLNFGFGRWKRIREAARLGNRPLREIALYGLAYLCKIAKVLKEDEKALFTRVYSNDPVENVEDSTDKAGEEAAVPALDQLIKGDESKTATEVKTETPAAQEQKPAVQGPNEGAVIVEQSAAPVKVEPALEPMQVEKPVETATEVKSEAATIQPEQPTEVPKEEPKEEVKVEQAPQEQAAEPMQVEQTATENVAATETKPAEETKTDASAASTEAKPQDEKSEAAEEAKSEADKNLEPHRVYENDPSLNDTKWLESLEKTGPSIVRRLELLAEIGYLVRTNFSEFEGTWVDYEFPDYPNWGEQEDRDLLKGTYKHGFGKYEKIRTDPDLCFLGKPKSFYEQEPVDEKKKKKREKAEKERAEKAKAEAEKAAAEKGEAMQTDQPEGATSSEPKAEAKPAEEAKKEPKVEEAKTEEKPAEAKASDDSEWLAAGPLSLRVKWLLKGFNSLRKRMEKQKRRHENQAAKDKKQKMKQERKDKLETEWSKREKQDFYRALITYGVPIDPETKDNNFDFLKQKAKLGFKNSQTISQYYVSLLKMCRQLKQSKTADPTKHKHKKQKTGEETEKVEKPEDYGLSEIQAMRALERVIMFINLRKKVLTMSTEELANRFKYARPREAKLPSWWVTPEHDIALLKGVDKHGYSKWEDVCNDKDLPFFEILSPMKPLEKKEKKKKPKPGAPAADANNNTNVPPTGSDATPAEAKPATLDLPVAEKDHEASTEEKKDDDKEDKEDKDDNEGDGEDQKFKTGLAQHMPREKILWKRIQQLIKLATDTQLQFKPATPNAEPNKATKQAMLSFGNGSILVSNDDNKDMDDFQAPKKKSAKKRKREDGAEEGNDDDKPAKKRRTGANGRGRNVDIHRDSSDNIVFPIKIGVATLIEALGTINTKPNFHSEKYIWPVGFKSTREFTSTKNIDERCMYTCEIVDGGDKPIFRVTPADDPETPSEASSASQAWKQILMRINERKPEQAKRTSVSGPEYFGFGFPAIADLIAKLPNADKCTKYKGPDAVERPGKKEDEEGDEAPQPKPEKKKKEESGEQKEKKKKKSKITFPALAVEPAKKAEGTARFDLPVQAPMPSLGGLPTIASLPVHRPEVTPVNIQPAPVSIQPAPVSIQPAPMNLQPVPTGPVSLLSDETFVPSVPNVHAMPLMQGQWFPAPMSYAGYPPLMPVHQFPVITNPQMNNNNNQPPQQK